MFISKQKLKEIMDDFEIVGHINIPEVFERAFEKEEQ